MCLIKQLQKCFPPPPSSPPAAPSHQSKKTNPLFDPQGASRFWWVQKQNCPKLSEDNFCFWSKFSKLKNQTQENKPQITKCQKTDPPPSMPILNTKNRPELLVLNNYEIVFLTLLLLLLLRHTSKKKLIYFLTYKEGPDFDGSKSKIARNCPKIIFAFDRKFLNSKMTP